MRDSGFSFWLTAHTRKVKIMIELIAVEGGWIYRIDETTPYMTPFFTQVEALTAARADIGRNAL